MILTGAVSVTADTYRRLAEAAAALEESIGFRASACVEIAARLYGQNCETTAVPKPVHVHASLLNDDIFLNIRGKTVAVMAEAALLNGAKLEEQLRAVLEAAVAGYRGEHDQLGMGPGGGGTAEPAPTTKVKRAAAAMRTPFRKWRPARFIHEPEPAPSPRALTASLFGDPDPDRVTRSNALRARAKVDGRLPAPPMHNFSGGGDG